MITCPQCNKQQMGGSMCAKCGFMFREQDFDAQAHSIIAKEEISQPSPMEPIEESVDHPDSSDQGSKRSNKFVLPPPPERVKRKQLEREKFRRSGFGKFLFWLYNMFARGLESVIFSGIFHGEYGCCSNWETSLAVWLRLKTGLSSI